MTKSHELLPINTHIPTTMPPKEKRRSLEESCTPIFDAATGRRLRMMRMKILMDQSELGEALGLSQKTISHLENGMLPISRVGPSVSKYREVFGTHTDYVLLGTGAAQYNFDTIMSRFDDRRKTGRKSKSPHWTARALREGYPRRQGQ